MPKDTLDNDAWIDELFKEQWFIDRVKAGPDQLRIYNYAHDICFTTDLKSIKSAILQHQEAEIRRRVVGAKINIISHILVYNATGKKRIGLSRRKTVETLAELQQERKELKLPGDTV